MDERLTAAQAREVMEQRAAIYEFLSIAYGEEVPLAFLRSLREQGPALDGELGDFVASLAGADDAALEAVRTDLAAEYARVFLGMSRRPVAPYESVYTSPTGLMMQEGARRGGCPLPPRGILGGREHASARRPHRFRARLYGRLDPQRHGCS